MERTIDLVSGGKRGFICPDWAKPHWDATQCSIEHCTDGTYLVLCHSTQEGIYVGETREECAQWLRGEI